MARICKALTRDIFHGIAFCRDEFDRERYREIAQIAEDMLARIGDVPIEKIQGLVSDFAQGYATPKVDVRGAIIENDAILLVRERSDGLWTLPGGFADVSLSASQNIEKEIWEEAGLRVKAHRLYAVRHKAKRSYDPDVRDFYKMFFLCDRLDKTAPRAGLETTEVQFFPAGRLPTLSRGRAIEGDIEAAFASASDEYRGAFFD